LISIRILIPESSLQPHSSALQTYLISRGDISFRFVSVSESQRRSVAVFPSHERGRWATWL